MSDVHPTGLPNYQNTNKLKVLSLFVLLIIALVGGAVPLYLVRDVESSAARTARRNRRITRAVSIMNSFSGGVFLGIALVHLLPSVRELLTDALHGHPESGVSEYPWAELCASAGFFFIVMVEQVLLGFEERFGSSPGHGILHHGHGHSGQEAVPSVSESAATPTPEEEEEDKGLQAESGASEDEKMSVRRALTILNACILMVALSIHSVLEGLALGLQLTRTATLDLLIALSLHKGIEAFTISLSIVQTPASRALKYITFIVFSCTSPIGVAIGIPITSEENVESVSMLLVNGILQGLATGTFMFVTFIEILPQELKAKGDRMIKFAVMLLGFGIIAGVTSLEFS
ncbi:Zinc transporter ZIP1 [Holothuria leucospilota]|uniref:Zinc transporter ZIP1 n=1 Tax=Holothuria leucospilota TaxID=206669 RepID=A0A9Q1H1B4_HOLLE|nr:Zinc transporter ZIP1 [Holothuria leucospilota]